MNRVLTNPMYRDLRTADMLDLREAHATGWHSVAIVARNRTTTQLKKVAVFRPGHPVVSDHSAG